MVDGKTFSDYRILARKYRPKNFSEIIGQDTTVQVLRNAISLGKYPQGIIFTGIRGGGKTTLARIISDQMDRAFQLPIQKMIVQIAKVSISVLT